MEEGSPLRHTVSMDLSSHRAIAAPPPPMAERLQAAFDPSAFLSESDEEAEQSEEAEPPLAVEPVSRSRSRSGSDSWSRSPAGVEDIGGAGAYRVLATATLRETADATSKKLGEFKKGTVINVVQAQTNAQGVAAYLTVTAPPGKQRGGWVKPETSKGKALLERLQPSPLPRAEPLTADTPAVEAEMALAALVIEPEPEPEPEQTPAWVSSPGWQNLAALRATPQTGSSADALRAHQDALAVVRAQLAAREMELQEHRGAAALAAGAEGVPPHHGSPPPTGAMGYREAWATSEALMLAFHDELLSAQDSQQQSDVALASLRTESAQQAERMTAQAARIAELQALNDGALKELETREAQIGNLHGQVAAATVATAEANSAMAAEELRVLEESLAAERKTVALHADVAAVLRRVVEEHEATIAKLTAKSVATKAELEARKVAMEELEPVAQELRAAVNAHAQDLGAAEAALAVVTGQLADEAASDELHARVARLETEVSTGKRELGEAVAEKERVEAEFARKDAELVDLNQQWSTRKSQLEQEVEAVAQTAEEVQARHDHDMAAAIAAKAKDGKEAYAAGWTAAERQIAQLGPATPTRARTLSPAVSAVTTPAKQSNPEQVLNSKGGPPPPSPSPALPSAGERASAFRLRLEQRTASLASQLQTSSSSYQAAAGTSVPGEGAPVVTFDQFVLSVRQGNPDRAQVPDSALREIFRELDVDGNGTLSQAELDAWVRDDLQRPV